MNKQDKFESERLYYKGIDEKDTVNLVKWRSDFNVIKYFRNPKPITQQEHNDWYSKSYVNNNSRFDFIIIEKRSNEKIGTAGVNNIDYIKKTCEISYMIAESSFQRKGYASEAVKALMERMQLENINIFYAEIHVDNIASINLINKLGYKYDYSQEKFSIYSISREVL